MSEPRASIEIRQMTVGDLDRVIAIASSFPSAPQWPRRTYLEALEAKSNPHRIALVTTEAVPGTVAGFAVARLVPPQAELETIAVARENQRRRIGRDLFDALAQELQADGAKEIVLEVRASNHPALGFYRCLGFLKTGLRRGYYREPIEDAVLMRLPLG